MTWAAEEFATVDLSDKRLNSRLVKVAEQLAAKPTASIPAACGGWGDTAQCTELKPPPPGRPGEDEAWSGPGHAARSALG